ncbi:MAG: EF2563 family selenium-dependent molybdenum hydroxylase system protein [Deltaproteobacteria bacterium]|nr:EF2563 family selenium-dependent molybdenum hydroxylase system protein [Deltaproteobacteria bacterium]
MIVLVRGGGEMATGVAHRLARSGFRVCLTEIPEPLAVRREVSFCEAVFEGQKEVEGLMAKKAADKEEIMNLWAEDKIPVVVDPQGVIRKELHPQVLVNAILAKRNLNTKRNHAPLVIGLGPGFRVGRDCHLVVETNRGHRLGRVIEEGEAEANTGLPGEISGYTWERVLRAPATGKFQGKKEIGDRVEKGEVVAEVEGFSVAAKVSGVLRGILRSGLWVQEKMKVGDIDPRGVREHCFTISEKARAIGGGVLEAILMRYNRSRVSN